MYREEMKRVVGYKYFVLVAACITQFLRGTLVNGTLAIYPLYYQQQYQDRVLSATIPSAGSALAYILSKFILLLL